MSRFYNNHDLLYKGSAPDVKSWSRREHYYRYWLNSLEAVLQDAGDIIAFTHCVEMHCRYSMCNEIFALHCTPFCSYLVNGSLVVAGFCYFLCQLKRNV